MKKTLFAVLALTFISSLCFAQKVSAPISNSTSAPVVAKTLTGKVDSLTNGDSTKGIKSGLVVVDDNGKTISFMVKNGTSVTDKDAKAITPSDLKKDNKVTVEYTTKASGINEAQSIKLIE